MIVNLNAPFLEPDGKTVSRAWAAFLSGLAQQQDVVVSFNGRAGTVRLTGSDVTQALGFTPADSDSVVLSFNGRNGTVTLSGADVATALGFTPAPVNDAELTGTPTAPTADVGTDTDQIATTKFVQSALPTVGSWKDATLLNGWVNYGAPFTPASYCIDTLGIVRLRGLVKSGTIGESTPIFQLPAGFLPPYTYIFVISSNLAFGEVRVDAQGNVYAESGSNSYVSLDGISFRNS